MAEPGRDVLRRRARLRVRVFVLVAALGCAAVIAPACADRSCEGNVCTTASAAREIDTICGETADGGPPNCELSGGAMQTTGITDDTIGFVINQGSLVVHLDAVPAAQFPSGSFDVDLLVATTDGSTQSISTKLTWGSCGSCSPAAPSSSATVNGDYSWVQVVTAETTAPIAVPIPPDATLTFTGSNIEIADIRTTSTFTTGCSIAGPLGSRRSR